MTRQGAPVADRDTGPERTSATEATPSPDAGRSLTPTGWPAVGTSLHTPVPGAPWLPRCYTPRSTLWDLLDEATRQAVTVLVAPAGAGKTMGVAGWLAAREHEGDPLWYSATAGSTATEVEALLDLAAAGGSVPGLVVVDDAHLLPAACVRVVSDRLASAPERLRLVLTARWDLSIPRLVPQLLGHLTVLRGDVLRLTHEESSALVRQHAPHVSDDVLDAIVGRADGWCAALVLAARASATMQVPADVAGIFRSSAGSLADLVAGEVFVGLRPQERHLLLCVAGEPGLTEEMAHHLTRDPRAGEVLDTLVATGLLVSRAASGNETGQDEYRIHPLLLEVVRRRLVAGGVDVQRARAAVLRAAHAELEHRDADVTIRHLLAGGADDEAAAVFAAHGTRVVLSGEPCRVATMTRVGTSHLADHPGTWGVLARAAWYAGDAERGRHWSGLLLRHDELHPGTVPPLEVQHVRLRRARTGSEPLDQLVEQARDALELARQRDSVADVHLPLLLMELGAAENWTGDLASAEEHLAEAVLRSRAEGLVAATQEASSHLAVTLVCCGREQSALQVAQQLLAAPTTPDPATDHRARTVQRLVTTWSRPLDDPLDDSASTYDVVPDDLDDVDDPTTQVLAQVLHARLALLSGALPEALLCLDALTPRLRVPRHLRVLDLVERSHVALVAGNRRTLRTVAQALQACGAEAEQLWCLAAAEDVGGDLRAALELYDQAASRAQAEQPATAAMAWTAAAQVAGVLGDRPRSHDLLLRAVEATDGRRLATPFLGWSRRGARVGQLLAEAPGVADSPWGAELAEACAGLPGLAAALAPVTATEGELASVAGEHPVPSLSPREREVLMELARGSTYGDAARNLFVSENTVKTHVSSLYSKLSVSRRSEALAVARTLHLI